MRRLLLFIALTGCGANAGVAPETPQAPVIMEVATGQPISFEALIDRLGSINSSVDQMVVKQDASGYIRANLEFHRTLYLRAQAPAMLAMIETVWLQLGPTMRQLYSRMQNSGRLGHHRAILAALKTGDEAALVLAVRQDVTQGLRMLAA